MSIWLAVLLPIAVHAAAFAGDCPRPAILPGIAGAIPRPGAWPDRQTLIAKWIASDQYTAIALGDSIVARWPADLLKMATGHTTLNAGFPGDGPGSTIWRIEQTDWKGQHPSLMILLIGTNNSRAPGCDLYWGVLGAAQEARQTFPGAKLVVISILPRGETLDENTEHIVPANAALKQAATEGHYLFLDVHDDFLCNHKTPCDLFDSSNLHPTRKGYELLSEKLHGLLSECLAGPKGPMGQSNTKNQAACTQD